MHYIAEIERRVDANMIRTDYRQLETSAKPSFIEKIYLVVFRSIF